MNEQDFNQGMEDEDIDVFGDDELDLGSSSGNEFDPFADLDFAHEPDEKPQKAEKPASKSNTKDASTKKEESAADPIAHAMEAAETKEAKEVQKNLFSKLPVFSYAAANEEVEDTTQTFEDLRISKASDFPELDDSKRVSWTVEYGKITKVVSEPKGTTIAKMKSDIEMSKEFLDSLKKSKEKEPVCKLKPKVTAQSKGKVSAYKGVYTSMEEAVNSGKVITLFPAKDGKVYEMRQNQMGRFITPSKGSDMLTEVKAGFIPALPPIPYECLLRIVSFFRMMALNGDYEALVNIYWDKEEERYILDVPDQTVTCVSVDSSPNPDFDNDRYLHFIDIHSHNRMKAFFSGTDDKDEKATRVYAVIGKVLDYVPEIKVRISNGGTFLEIDPGIVFEKIGGDIIYPTWWNGQVKIRDKELPPIGVFGASPDNFITSLCMLSNAHESGDEK